MLIAPSFGAATPYMFYLVLETRDFPDCIAGSSTNAFIGRNFHCFSRKSWENIRGKLIFLKKFWRIKPYVLCHRTFIMLTTKMTYRSNLYYNQQT